MDKTPPLYGMFRAKVVDNKDPEKFGRVILWIPDIMPLVDQTKGLWARPANNPVGGRNMEEDVEHHYMGSSYIPKIGAWVFVFFECGDINKPYYFGALDLENTKVLPENQLGTNYEDKWTILKTHTGRCIIVSDDPDDERVEVTGKKREIKTPPTGDTASVYAIDDNMTTILLDERDGMQKVLIRTYKGDFFHVDIDERKLQAQFESDIEIKTNASLYITAEKDIHILANGDLFNMECANEMNMKSGQKMQMHAGSDMNQKTDTKWNQESASDTNMTINGNLNVNVKTTSSLNTGTNLEVKGGAGINIEAGAIMNLKAGAAMNREAGAVINDKAAGLIMSDGVGILDMCGAAGSASSAAPTGPTAPADADTATPATPEGDRDT